MLEVVATSLTYLAFAVCAPRSRKREGKSYILFVHNCILCAMSLAMFLGTAKATLERRSEEGGMDWFFCETRKGDRWLFYYYASKYYELLDTVLAVYCGKPPRHYWTHVYHHFCVLYMASFYVQGQTLAVGGTLFNTFVHVPMYYYYARSALKLRTSWKSWITRLQIVQFITSFLCLVVALHKRPDLLSFSKGENVECVGRGALAYNCFFNATLLVLFIRVLFSSNPPRPKKRI